VSLPQCLIAIVLAGTSLVTYAKGGHTSTATADKPGVTLPAKNHSSPFASMRGGHVGLRVADYKAAKQWYVEKLDFRVVKEWPFNGQHLAYIAPATDDRFFIELLGDGERPTPKPTFKDVNASAQVAGYHHLCLDVADVDKALATLRKRGVKVVAEPFLVPDIKRRLAFIEDPWGNVIELAEEVK